MKHFSDKRKSPYQDFEQKRNNLLQLKSLEAWPHIIILLGSSAYLIEKTQKQLAQHWENLSQDQEATTLRLESTELKEGFFNEEFLQKDLFAQCSLYIIKRSHTHKALLKAFLQMDPIQDVSQYLILCYEGTHNGLVKHAQKLKATVLVCEPPRPFELGAYIQSSCQALGLKLEPQAIKFIEESLGHNLSLIDNELTKLHAIYYEQCDQPLSTQDITQHLNMLRHDDAFKLTQHLLHGEKACALALLSDLLAQGQSSLAILGLITRHVRLMIQAKSLLQQKRLSLTELSKKMALTPYQTRPYFELAGQLTSGVALHHIMQVCQNTDQLFKSTKINDDMLLSYLITQLNHG